MLIVFLYCQVLFISLKYVIDASSIDKKVSKEYHVCETVILTKKEKQPTSTYSKISSCKSDEFISKNKYITERIDSLINTLNRSFTGV